MGIVSFLILQIFRLVSLALFGIFVVDCTLWLDATSVDCKNFTVYKDPLCDGYCWKTLWLVSSLATSSISVCLMCHRINPELRPVRNIVVIRFLFTRPFFWSLNLLLVLVIIYDALIIHENEDEKTAVEVLVVLSKVFTVVVVFQLNCTLCPSQKQGFRCITVITYYLCIFVFVLDNFLKFTTVSAQVAFKFYTISKGSSVKALGIIDLMLMVVNGLLYHKFLQFFWEKLFLGEKDILMVYRVSFVETLDKTNRRQNTDPND